MEPHSTAPGGSLGLPSGVIREDGSFAYPEVQIVSHPEMASMPLVGTVPAQQNQPVNLSKDDNERQVLINLEKYRTLKNDQAAVFISFFLIGGGVIVAGLLSFAVHPAFLIGVGVGVILMGGLLIWSIAQRPKISRTLEELSEKGVSNQLADEYYDLKERIALNERLQLHAPSYRPSEGELRSAKAELDQKMAQIKAEIHKKLESDSSDQQLARPLALSAVGTNLITAAVQRQPLPQLLPSAPPREPPPSYDEPTPYELPPPYNTTSAPPLPSEI